MCCCIPVFGTEQTANLLLNDGVANYNFLSALEIEVVKELNLARTNPKQYAEFLKEYRKYYQGNYIALPGKNLRISNEGVKVVDEAIEQLLSYKPIQPLKISLGMSLAAKDHVNDQGQSGAMGHIGNDLSSPFARMNRYGTWNLTAGENIDYGNDSARLIVINLIVDDGVIDRGHRKSIFNKDFNVVGVACGPHIYMGYMCVMTFAGAYKEKTK